MLSASHEDDHIIIIIIIVYLYTIIWFHIFLSNTNNFQIYSLDL